MSEGPQLIRMVEALLFAAAEPLDVASLAARLPDGADVKALLAELADQYAERGITLHEVAGGWAFRTAPDLAFLMEREKTVQRRLSRAAVETLAIIAYHQPITRAEIEEVRGVSISKGTLDVLMEAGWIRLRGRKQTPGRPLTYGTTPEFLDHFGLTDVKDLPGIEELKAAGLLSAEPPEEMVREAEQQAAANRGEKPDDEEGEDGADEETEAVESASEAGAEETAEARSAAPDTEHGAAGHNDDIPDIAAAGPEADIDEDDEGDEGEEDEQDPFRPAAGADGPLDDPVPVSAKGPNED